MEFSPRTPKGFTLIELLIVVAIIAILAAIAIPNFLEAQTRAKVSRTKSDMRTLAIGLESFRVDHNFYPPVNDFEHLLPRLIILTTPVAYLSEIPEDVFTNGLPSTNENSADPDDFFKDAVLASYTVDGQIVHPRPFEYICRVWADDDWSMYCTNPGARKWLMKSLGPSQVLTMFYAMEFSSYDPSNGTISAGAIILAGPQ